MVEIYFDRAEELMALSNLCEDSEISNILKTSASKIYDLARQQGAILKSASKNIDKDHK